MVALHPYLSEQTTFEPPAIEAMSRAFEEASPALKIPSSKSHEREVIAMQGPDSSCSWVGAGVVARQLVRAMRRGISAAAIGLQVLLGHLSAARPCRLT